MKILHFSDTHLGYSEGTKVDTETGVNLREVDVCKAFSQVLDSAKKLKPDIIVHSGDLFDNPRPSNRAIFFALKAIKGISIIGIPLVLISGNHSTPRIKTSGSIFEPFGLFANVYPVHSNIYEEIKISNVSIHCLPHMINEVEMQKSFEKIKPNPKSEANIIVAHVGVSGQHQFKMGEFNELIVPFSILAEKKHFDYIALGHYHKHIQLLRNCCYAGSTERFSFDEAGQDKGFIMVELGKEPEFIPIKTREMLVLNPIDCNNLSPLEIMKSIESLADKIKDRVVQITFKNISRHKYVNIDFAKIRELTSEATYVKFTYDFVTEEGKKATDTPIGTLTAEFESFLANQKIKHLNKNKLKEIGLQYLSTALMPEEL